MPLISPKSKMEIKDYEFENSGVTTEEFKEVFGKEPDTQEEMNKFGYLCKKGMNSQINWDMIFQSVKDNWND